MEQRHVGRRAIVTGAGSGIGRATARRLAAEGAVVACLDIDGHEATASEIGAPSFAMRCDVSSADEVLAIVDVTVARLGGLDIVCNIAGIGRFERTEEADVAVFDRIVSVNLNGTYYVCRYAIPHLLAAGGGVIVNTSSTAGLIGQPWSAAYCASKGGVSMLTKALATEFKDRNIRINAVAPGGTNTNIIKDFGVPEGVDFKALMRIMSPMKTAEPEEMAALFSFIASDEARYMTGSIVAMDGGVTA